MGDVHATIELSNPREPDRQPISAQALADSGALKLSIPEHLALQLNLQQPSGFGTQPWIVEEPPKHHLGVEQQSHQLLKSSATC
jgi:hypothetical protein